MKSKFKNDYLEFQPQPLFNKEFGLHFPKIYDIVVLVFEKLAFILKFL